ncbi:MAG: hypothetical protein ABJE66_15715 [Deltaproteobacteria bacterium]
MAREAVMGDDDLAAIAAVLEGGDERAAFTKLRARFGWPRGKQLGRGSASELVPWISMLGTLAAKRGAAQLDELARAVVADPESPDRLYDLGFALIDAGVPAIAATVLWRCLSLVGDSEEVVCELVSALETAMAYEDAYAILAEREALRASSFLCQYLFAFDAAMTGRLDVVRETLPKLVVDAAEHATMKGTIERIIARADRVAGTSALDAGDLRGWHYVLTGGLLLHQSPFGFPAPMHGRYAWLQDSTARIATGLDRLKPFVAGLPCIYAPEGRDHEIVAQAASARLGIPVAPWPAIGVPAPGLIVAYQLDQLPRETLGVLASRRPDQVLYAHASPWTSDFPIAPDLTMLLCQSLVAPWGEVMKLDPETREMTRTPADARSVEEIAAEIVASTGVGADEVEAEEPARWDALVEKAWPLIPGPRSRLWAGGPVASNRFE